MKQISDKAYLIKNTGIVSIGRFVGVVTGLLLDAVILASFGIGHETDAFFAALAIPFLIDGTLGIQLTQVLISILASIQKESGLESVWRLLSNLITIWVLVASALACLAMATAAYIIPIQVPGLAPAALHIAGRLNMLLVWIIPLSFLAAILQGALFSFHQFWLTSSTKAINNICIISVVILFHRAIGIQALALGYLVGFAVQCVVLWAGLWRCGFVFGWTCNFRDPLLKDATRLVLYPLAGQMVGECRTLIENFYASFYAPGVLSALRYASRIIYALSGVLMSSVVAATTPIVAQYVAEKNFDGMKRTVRNGIQVLVFISLPVCAWLAFTGDSLISLLFERGQFSRPDVLLTSSLMALMTPYILFSRAVSISQTPFYAVKDTKTLGLSMVLSFLLYATMISPLLHWYGVYGFPLAISLSSALGVLVMCVFMHRSFGSMGWSKLQTFGVRMAGVVAAMVAALMVAGRFEVHVAAARITDKLFAIGIPSAFAMVAFLGTAVALRVISTTDISQGLNFLRRKLSV